MSRKKSRTTTPKRIQLRNDNRVRFLYELLWSMSRREWVNAWFRGGTSEIAPVLLVLIAFGAALLWALNWAVGVRCWHSWAQSFSLESWGSSLP